jgi:hypothetical protein
MDVVAKSRDAISRDGRSDSDELDRCGVHLILPRALKSAPLATHLLRKMYDLLPQTVNCIGPASRSGDPGQGYNNNARYLYTR